MLWLLCKEDYFVFFPSVDSAPMLYGVPYFLLSLLPVTLGI